jgi:ABC-2 type transport system ATP-binding protein
MDAESTPRRAEIDRVAASAPEAAIPGNIGEPPPTGGPVRTATTVPAIEVRDLRKHFGDREVLRGLSFCVGRGEIFGFIGPNGAGKTTTIRILATLLEPSSGDAWVCGHGVEDDSDAVRRIVGYMPDDAGVYEGLTVDEYLDFFARAYRLDAARRRRVIDGVLELTDLGPLRRRLITSFSKGMRQRLLLAKTLIHDPSVLILDEPASALDPRARIELRALLSELRRMGKSILISSHILAELADLCTSIGVVESGRLVASGSVGELAARITAGRRVELTLHAESPAAGEILSALPTVGNIESAENVIAFEFLGALESFHEVLAALVDAHVPVVEVRQSRSRLEDLFLELTRGDVQ